MTLKRWIGLGIAVVLVGGLIGFGYAKVWWDERPADVRIDHKTGTTATRPLADKAPAPGAFHQRWRTSLRGESIDNPAFQLAAGHVLVTGEYAVEAIDARSGKRSWHYWTGSPVQGIAVTNGAVVLVTGTPSDPNSLEDRKNRIVGLEASTGRMLWERAEHWDAYATAGQWRLASGSGSVFVTTPENETLLAIDARTGDERWSLGGEGAACKPGERSALSEDDGDATRLDGSVILVAEDCAESGDLSGLDPATGKVLWKRPHPGEDASYITSDGLTLIEPDKGQGSGDLTLIDRQGTEIDAGSTSRPDDDLRLLRAGPYAVVVDGSERPRTRTIELRTKRVREAGHGWRARLPVAVGSRLYGLDRRPFFPSSEFDLQPASVDTLDPVTGRIRRAPLILQPDLAEREPVWMGVSGERLFVAYESLDETTLVSYATTPVQGPTELGGSQSRDWPKACALFPGNRSGDVTAKAMTFGAVEIPQASCTRTLNARGDKATVRIIWVLPQGEPKQRLFARPHPSSAKADEEAQALRDINVVRVGRVIVSIEAKGDDLRTKVATDVVRSLRDLDNRRK